jgi:Domain of unknown function (DUF4402)
MKPTAFRVRWGAALLPAIALLGLLLASTAQAQTPLQITKLRDLYFGGCDNVGGATYTVAAAASPGAGACFGAQSAQFTITGDPGRFARMTLPSRVNVTNGTETLRVTITDSVGANRVCLGSTGTVTVYLGGSVTLPGGALVSFGLFINTDQFQLVYTGGNC